LFKKEKKEEPKVMNLGNDANFKYDPIKKRYVFEGEEEEPEEEIKAPPKQVARQKKEEPIVQPKTTQPRKPVFNPNSVPKTETPKHTNQED
jgi:heme-binding NEAT domain protein